MVSRLAKLLLPVGQFRPRVLVTLVRNRWFIRMRWLIVGVMLVVLLAERTLVTTFARPPQLLWCILLLGVVNLVWTVVGRTLVRGLAQRVVDRKAAARVAVFVNVQMTVDLVLLTMILRYSGSLENPMVVFYLFHTLLAALLLRPLNAILQGCWALLLYSGLMVGERMAWVVPHYPFLPYATGTEPHLDWGYVLAGAGVLAVGVFGTVYFTLQISRRLNEQETELRRTMQALATSQDAITALQARRSRFMQTAAHQLKSPLAGVQTLTGLIRDGVVPADALAATCERIVDRCQEGMDHVRELLTLARLQQQEPRQHSASSSDAEEVVAQVCQRFQTLATDRGVRLRCVVGQGRDLRAQVESRSLADCVGNLVDNGLKYTRPGGEVVVSVARTPGAEIRIRVRDTGMGFDTEALVALQRLGTEGTVFDAYQRGNNALASGTAGAGLGLAIVREVVEQSGGRIEVASLPGAGTTFDVFVPAADGGTRVGVRRPGSVVRVRETGVRVAPS